ncbi:nitrous oxide reductase family maturation protein NosD [Pseudothioclava nitratireducens]|uniref:nitrous oxide reductase family maturation protein NosD n=1 Tax=Pseudothioclava nitratireducens TaxID=1928646 RepID=UPI0023DC34C7|nr:nitrous oxide reductase family maturation protein NosD [Defluviimonas nitratireducens]MDF1618928.1 nitrous oxide reductase family maturation protein NosD [Defluviimonas nitratireducens]
MIRRAALVIAACAALLPGLAQAGALQDMIDAAPDGAEIVLPAGVHEGPIVITHPVVIDGQGAAVIDGGGTGTVVTIETNGVTLKNLTIRNSGRLHNKVDAGLRIHGSFNVIRDVRIENSLFGMDLTQASNNVLRRNYISSKDMPLEMRGDSVRIWYSNDNIFEQNHIEHSRDFVIWYSEGNKIRDNRIQHGRYGIHFMYAHENFVEDNEISDCVVGIFLMYANDIRVTGNQILRAWGASGMGVGFKETSGAVVEDNKILGNAIGIYLDPSPWDPDKTNEFHRNHIAYNGVGVEFHTDWVGNNFSQNNFRSNFTQVSVRGRGTALREGWHGNHWDDFAGFDRDGDGIGDSPYEVYNYADRLWMDLPPAQFFRGGIALSALDFVERLAPFTEPRLLVREAAPVVEPIEHAAAVAPTATQSDRPKTALEMLTQ